MNKQFTIDLRMAQRVVCAMFAALLIVAGLPLFGPHKAAADQFTKRSIQMSDSGPSGTSITTGVGSGTAVSYQVTFTNAHAAKSMVIDFCSEDPIINDTCTKPTGFSASSATLVNVSGQVGTGWALTQGAGQAKIANSGTSNPLTAGATQIFDINGITNPSTLGTFYARIYTYSDATYGSTSTAYASATSVGSYVDYGGIALSTASTITITARVQESLTFCVTQYAPPWATHNCSDTNVSSAANLPAITIGHSTGSGVPVLDPNSIDTKNVYSQLSTNATNGAVINMRNSNTSCGGLSANGGTSCAIPAIGGGSGTPSQMTQGVAAFGLFVSDGTADTDPSAHGSGVTTASSAYNDHNGTHTNYYGMDTTTASAQPTGGGAIPSEYNGSVISTYGSTVATAAGPVFAVYNTYTFAATSGLTTPAGIYTANLSMIATGTF